MDEDIRRKNRRTFLLLAAIFLGTPTVAFIAFRWTDVGHGATVNKGVLVDPPVPLEITQLPAPDAAPVALPDSWTLVHVALTGCEVACQAEVATARQVWLALGRDGVRVQRLLVSGAPATDLAAQSGVDPALRVLDGGDPAVAAFAAVLTLSAPGAGLYMVDPLGNLMMSYPAGFAPKDLQSDLKRLLKLSEPWMRKP